MDTGGEMAKLHMYRNDVVEWFAAESREEAVELARKYLIEACGCDEDEIDLDLRQEPDDKLLVMDDDGEKQGRTAAEWAALNGKGFWGSTEY